MRVLVALFLGILVVLAGCGQADLPEKSGQADSADQTSTAAATSTPTEKQTRTTDQITTTRVTTTETPKRSTSIDTGRVLLTLSELPEAYTLEGETFERRSQATGDTLTRMKEQNLQLVHERAFSTTSAEYPRYVFASVTVYDSPDVANEWLTDHLDQLRESGGSVQSQRISRSVNASEARFENDQGLKTVALYERQGDLVFYVAVSGTTYKGDLAGRLFGKMVSELSTN